MSIVLCSTFANSEQYKTLHLFLSSLKIPEMAAFHFQCGIPSIVNIVVVSIIFNKFVTLTKFVLRVTTAFMLFEIS